MGIFDGLSTLVAGVLGAPVTVTPAVGVPFEVQGVFRREPIDVLDESGASVLVTAPTLKVTKMQAALIVVGDTIAADGAVWEILNRQTMGAPSADAMVMFELLDVSNG